MFDNNVIYSGSPTGEVILTLHADGTGTLERIFLPAGSLIHNCEFEYDAVRGCYAFKHPVEIRPMKE